MKLWLARHAQPLVAAGVCYGATDLAADPGATFQAAQALAQVLPNGLVMRASPLRRCQQLAQALQTLRPDLTCAADARLKEMSFGCWEGRRWDTIPQEAYDDWMRAFADHRFGGQESVSEFIQRVAQVWDAAQAQAQDTVWISHAGVIRVARLLAQGVRQIELAAQWPKDAPAFGQWCVITS